MSEQVTSDSRQEPRRNFLLEFWSIAIGGIVSVIPFLAGIAVLLDPLRRSKADGGGKWIRVASSKAVLDDGVPRQFPVITEATDAWTFSPAERVGAVYLTRLPGSRDVQALNVVCPHAGCFVGHDAAGKTFQCPCHTSRFSLAGVIIRPSPSPRDMDDLETRLTDDGLIEVRFVNYYPGKRQRIEKK